MDVKMLDNNNPPPNILNGKLGHYRILKKIGQGGMSTVYEAMDERLKRKVAIKILHPHLQSQDEHCQRFLRGSVAVAKLHHPNIVQIFDVGLEENLYIVTEFVDGILLNDYFLKYPIMLEIPELSALIIWQIAQALFYAHEQGIIHRDIKEENIMITKDGHIKLMDFGIASLKNDEKLTQNGLLLGSLLYVAPEIIKGEKASIKTDIFSLCIVFYYLLTKEKPFKHSSTVKLLKSILEEEPTPIQKLSLFVTDDLAQICEIGLKKEPKNRFENAQSLALKIEQVLKDMGVIASESMLTKALKNPTQSLIDFNLEILNKIQNQITILNSQNKEIKALALLQRIKFKKPLERKYKTKYLGSYLIIGLFGTFFFSMLFWPKKKTIFPLPLTNFNKKTETKDLNNLLSLSEKPKVEKPKIIKSKVTMTIWPFADVYVDKKLFLKKTKYLTVSLPRGKHTLLFTHPYAQSEEKIIDIIDDKPLELIIRLEKTKPAKLIVKSQIDAEIAIDNIYKGTTKESEEKPIIIPLPNKTSHIKKDILVKKLGFKPFLKNIEFTAGEILNINITLEK